MSDSSYTDLAQRIEESFAEIEDEAISDFRETDEEYNALYQQILRLKEDNPFIGKVMDGSGDISITAAEHEVLTEKYFSISGTGISCAAFYIVKIKFRTEKEIKN